MGITIQNIPFFCLLWIGIGFIFIMLGLFMIASRNEPIGNYTEFSNEKLSKEYSKEVGELFSFFLEEEEKKNQGLRDIVLDAALQKDASEEEAKLQGLSAIKYPHHNLKDTIYSDKADETDSKKSNQSTSEVNEIIKLFEEGLTSEEIAKKLKKGVGEVNLMISLYTMR